MKYLHRAKCIFTVGPGDVVLIDDLLKNNTAIVATTDEELGKKFLELYDNRSMESLLEL